MNKGKLFCFLFSVLYAWFFSMIFLISYRISQIFHLAFYCFIWFVYVLIIIVCISFVNQIFIKNSKFFFHFFSPGFTNYTALIEAILSLLSKNAFLPVFSVRSFLTKVYEMFFETKKQPLPGETISCRSNFPVFFLYRRFGKTLD